MFPDMGEITVISIVLQLLFKTINDVDRLVSRRYLMLVSSLKIFIQLKLYLVILPQSKTLFSVYSSSYWISFCEDVYVK